MNKFSSGIVCVVLASLLSACASMEPNPAAEAKTEKQYVTGSNVPKKDRSGVTTVSGQAVENALAGASAAPPSSTR